MTTKHVSLESARRARPETAFPSFFPSYFTLHVHWRVCGFDKYTRWTTCNTAGQNASMYHIFNLGSIASYAFNQPSTSPQPAPNQSSAALQPSSCISHDTLQEVWPLDRSYTVEPVETVETVQTVRTLEIVETRIDPPPSTHQRLNGLTASPVESNATGCLLLTKHVLTRMREMGKREEEKRRDKEREGGFEPAKDYGRAKYCTVQRRQKKEKRLLKVPGREKMSNDKRTCGKAFRKGYREERGLVLGGDQVVHEIHVSIGVGARSVRR